MSNFLSVPSVLIYIGYIFIAILVLLLMVLIHELGHYIAGKIFKFGIEEFAIGFGPKIFSKTKKNGEKFSIRALPIGGFCAIEGEDGVRCRAGSTAFWMTWDGRMLPCGMMPSPTAYPLEVGFDAAWEQIKAETAQIRLPSACGTCPRKEVCAACAAVCVTETGRFDGVPGYVCRMTEATVEKTWNAYLERNAGEDED